MKIYKLIDRDNEKVTPKKEGRRREKQPRQPGHKFKFWSMDIALNTIPMNRFRWTRFLLNRFEWTRFLLNRFWWTRFLLNRFKWTRFLLNTVQWMIFNEHSKWTGINWTKFYEPENDKSMKVKYVHKYIKSRGTIQFLCTHSTKIFFRICDTSISTYQLDQNILAHHQNHNFYVSTWPKYSVTSLTLLFLRIYSTKIFFRIRDTSISTYQLDRNILSHPRHLNFFVSIRPKYSIASSTPPFLRIYSTRIFYCILDTSNFFVSTRPEVFYRILDTSISSYLLDRNILSHPQQLHFFVSTRPEYSIASSTPPFLRIYLTRIFYRILNTSISLYLLDRNIPLHPRHLHFFVSTRPEYSIGIRDTSISTYLLDQNILSHPRHLHFFVSSWPEYSIASLTPPFLCIYSTKIFHCILFVHLQNFFVSTQPEYSIASSTPPFLCIYLTRIFYRILDTSISLYLLDRNILSHPRQLHFFVSTRPKYSSASLTPPFLRTYSTRIFYRILNTSISTYLLDQIFFCILTYQFLRIYSTRIFHRILYLTTPFPRIYSTRIFHRILDTSISMYQLDQNIRSHPWHLHFYVSSVPKYSFASWLQLEVCFFVSTKMMMNKQNRANEQLKHLDYHASFYC